MSELNPVDLVALILEDLLPSCDTHNQRKTQTKRYVCTTCKAHLSARCCCARDRAIILSTAPYQEHTCHSAAPLTDHVVQTDLHTQPTTGTGLVQTQHHPQLPGSCCQAHGWHAPCCCPSGTQQLRSPGCVLSQLQMTPSDPQGSANHEQRKIRHSLILTVCTTMSVCFGGHAST